MSSLSRELVFLILQFLDEEKFKETVHRLEQESGFFFNVRYFEEMVTNGEWDEVEKYLSGFTKVDDNRYSMKIFFEIRKQKYLEALDKKDRAKAVEILVKDLKVFSAFNEDLFKEITQLLTLENFRDNEQLSKYGDTKSARSIMLGELKKLIEANPLFRDKLNFPTLKNSRLRTLINQSLNWQHQLCKNPKPNPDIKTLFVDHSCGQSQPNGARAPSPVNNPLMGAVPKPPAGFPPLGAHGPFQPAPAALPSSLAGWMANPSAVSHPSASAGPLGFNPANNSAALLKRPRTPPTNPAIDYQTADSEHVLKRTRTFGISDEVNHLPVNILPVGYSGQSHGQSSYSSDDLPKTVVMTLNQGSAVKSMDFHPDFQLVVFYSPSFHPLTLTVGTNTGEVMIWELGNREKLVQKNFKVWDLGLHTVPLQASMSSDYTASVNRVTWSPDGTLFGVAFSKHIVQIYSYHGGDDLRNHLEIDAHIGSVNDLAFSYPNKQLCIVTCGEDRLIKVWDAVTGAKQFTFEGHEAPVYSVCPHFKENIQFIFSTATDGKIKAWLYDNVGSRVDYDAPGHSSTTMAYNADGTRLFSCGTNKEGESHIVEWNESEGAVKRTYNGLGKRSTSVVQFDTTKNRFLAAGDEFVIKFWDMDNTSLLTTIDAEGGLPAAPCIRFNKEGILMAVSTKENGIKILANPDGIRLLRTMENNRSFDPSRVASASAAVVKSSAMSTFGAANPSAGPSIMDRATPIPAMVAMNGDNRSLVDVKPRIGDESMDKSRIWKLTEITEPSQCRSIRLPDTTSSAMRVSRLIYTNSGLAILALAANAATANIVPQLWQPASGILMTNVVSDTNPEEAVPCFALSKNDSYVMSASGGKISLFNMMTFKTMTTFMPPPPAATFLAFHPQDNNIIAIGMEDSSIQIYNVRIDEVKTKLKGHTKRITGLAFSNVLSVLVSSGADSQLCVWSTEGWEKQTTKSLQIPPGRVAAPVVDTRVQFHNDQTQLLVVHETQLAIYEAPKLERVKQWVPPETSGLITHATYSCDSQSIYASFEDGSVGILTASTLRLRCRITSGSYLSSNPNSRVYPLVIAAHPTEANQFALGLTDGGVVVLEPQESEGKWGTSPPAENGAGPSSITAGATSTTDQAQSLSDSTAYYDRLGLNCSGIKLCVWSTEGWEKQTTKSLQIPPGRVAAPVVDTRVQFHNDQTQLLVVHETQLAIYEAPKLERVKQWVPPETSGLITHATYSCDSQSIYASFEDGSVGILTASTLRLRCRITSGSYLSSNPNSRVYPLVIAAHPTEANQFALGLTDGGVVVLEPQESEGKWGTSPPAENGAGPSSITAGATSTTDQAQREETKRDER
ncbi:WUS-interacting protein 2 [Artemisia annua]|uniref:WUS-interacting protein 2 n=1 Tax=Artemisia annua TaxID=35608 RepID=A0A2U1NIP5_ARTAN|nr:WUS-interacting protein 2 [Artemisia annua]